MGDGARHEESPTTNAALWERARLLMPGGVNSPVRAFGSVGGGVPPFVHEARGSRLWDVEGREYMDYVGSWGVMILGHGHPAVRSALAAAVERGTSFGTPSPAEVEFAERIVEMVPSVERIRLVNSGTEAVMSAVRLARAVTGRNKVVKFRGGYHGHADLFLVAAGSGAATIGVPSSPGVPEGVVRDTLLVDYNDLAGVARLFEDHGPEIAAVVVEPVAGNMGCVPPVEGFLEGLRGLCDDQGALLVFDEVMTGFRVGPAGAQGRYGVTPDLTTLGKVIGGGLPVGAYGGRADLMKQVAPEGPVYQAGTLSGNPLATAAGCAVLRVLAEEPEIHGRLQALGRLFDEGFRGIGERLNLSLTWNRVGAMGSLFFSAGPVVDWPSVEASDRERFSRFFRGMLERGFHLPPSPFEAFFWSAAHTEEEVRATLAAAEEVLAAEVARDDGPAAGGGA